MIGTIIRNTVGMFVISGAAYLNGYIRGYATGHEKGSGMSSEEYLQSRIIGANKVRDFMEDYETFREGIGA